MRARIRPEPAAIDRAIDSQPWDSLAPHLLKAGADVESATARLRQYAKLLLEWNRGVSNLISRHDEPRILERHIRESIEPAAWLMSSGASRWLDFGSGGGLPVIPLVLLGVGVRWTLVESRRTKTLFIRRTAEVMELSTIEVINARLEEPGLLQDRLGAYDGFTSRATLTLGPTLELAARFVAPGGFAFLWKGSRREAEMASDRRWEANWELDGLLGIGSGPTVVARFSRKT